MRMYLIDNNHAYRLFVSCVICCVFSGTVPFGVPYVGLADGKAHRVLYGPWLMVNKVHRVKLYGP